MTPPSAIFHFDLVGNLKDAFFNFQACRVIFVLSIVL